MSRIYCCEFGNDEIECKRVFQENNEEEANRFSQRRAGGLNAKMQLKVIRDGQKLYQFVVFTNKDNTGYINIKSNKILSLKRNDIANSIESTFPKTALEYLSSVTGINFNGDKNKNEEDVDKEKQESFLRKMFLI